MWTTWSKTWCLPLQTCGRPRTNKLALWHEVAHLGHNLLQSLIKGEARIKDVSLASVISCSTMLLSVTSVARPGSPNVVLHNDWNAQRMRQSKYSLQPWFKIIGGYKEGSRRSRRPPEKPIVVRIHAAMCCSTRFSESCCPQRADFLNLIRTWD